MAGKKKPHANKISRIAAAKAHKHGASASHSPGNSASSPQVHSRPSFISNLFDRQSFLIGAVAGIIILAAALFIYAALQAPPSLPALSNNSTLAPPASSPVSIVANSSLPSVFQVAVKNNEKLPVQITGLQIGNDTYNVTATLAPGEIRAFNLPPPSCSQQGGNCSVIINFNSSGGQGTSGNGTPESGRNLTSNATTKQTGGTIPSEPLSIVTSSITPAEQDRSYQYGLEATGGSGHYLWEASGLPDGLSVNSQGLIHGVPMVPGSYTITITAYDGSSSASLDLPMTVTPYQ
ncbi:Uncharacterised protein [uncultured archaeon]|nr:Uncharacterised protein [uncultured archaeon]